MATTCQAIFKLVAFHFFIPRIAATPSPASFPLPFGVLSTAGKTICIGDGRSATKNGLAFGLLNVYTSPSNAVASAGPNSWCVFMETGHEMFKLLVSSHRRG